MENDEFKINDVESELILDLSPASSLLDNVQYMSAALMKAIEENKDVFNQNEENDKSMSEIEEVMSTTLENKSIEIKESLELSEDINVGTSPCSKTFVVNDISFDEMKDQVSEDFMLKLISESFSDSERLWNVNLEEYRKMREETPFLSALQRETTLSNKIDSVSEQLFEQLYSTSLQHVMSVFASKKLATDNLRDELMVTDFEFYQEESNLQSQAEDEKFWCDGSDGGRRETSPTQDEAEKLRLKQLQIEQEIEELEAAGMRGFYVREIPNKPPPPYTPPRTAACRPTKTLVTQAVESCVSLLWDSDVVSDVPDGLLDELPDGIYRDMLWNLCVELYSKAKPSYSACPPWQLSARTSKLAPSPRSKEEMVRWCTKQANVIFGFEPSVRKENMIIRWSHKKRDRVDDILIKECQQEESQWVDYSKEENIIKNRIAESIFQNLVDEASQAFLGALLKKKQS